VKILDLKIDRLELNIEDAAGHEHRLRPIVLRTLGISRIAWTSAGRRKARPAPKTSRI
jgi:hypothetical protein